jgi:hypothetical protein
MSRLSQALANSTVTTNKPVSSSLDPANPANRKDGSAEALVPKTRISTLFQPTASSANAQSGLVKPRPPKISLVPKTLTPLQKMTAVASIFKRPGPPVKVTLIPRGTGAAAASAAVVPVPATTAAATAPAAPVPGSTYSMAVHPHALEYVLKTPYASGKYNCDVCKKQHIEGAAYRSVRM